LLWSFGVQLELRGSTVWLVELDLGGPMTWLSKK
jgi:hypothetical protein